MAKKVKVDKLTLSVLEVMPPQWSDLVLASYVPYSERNIFVLDRLNVET